MHKRGSEAIRAATDQLLVRMPAILYDVLEEILSEIRRAKTDFFENNTAQGSQKTIRRRESTTKKTLVKELGEDFDFLNHAWGSKFDSKDAQAEYPPSDDEMDNDEPSIGGRMEEPDDEYDDDLDL